MEAIGYRGIAFTPTGRAALLIENGDWLLMHRERPVEVPNAGA